MYKRHTGQVSMLDNPEFFGSLPLDPNNRWIKLSKQIPWHEFDLKYLYIHFMRSLYWNKLNPKKYMNHILTLLPDRFAKDPNADIEELSSLE